jgi:anthranilate synthase component 2
MIVIIDNYDSFTYNLYQMVGAIVAATDCEASPRIRVIRNDAMRADEIIALAPTHIILSPGPGRPEDSGVCPELIRELMGHGSDGPERLGEPSPHPAPSLQSAPSPQPTPTLQPTSSPQPATNPPLASPIPLLGVCLGHQVICQACGATITYAEQLMHGKSSEIQLAADTTTDNATTTTDAATTDDATTTTVRLFAGLPRRIQGARYHSLLVDPATIPDELHVIARTARGEVMAVEHRDLPMYGLQFHPESILTPLGGLIAVNFLSLSTTKGAR